MKTSLTALSLSALLFAGAASAACVHVPEANLRQGPSTTYDKSWEVYKYMPLKKIGQKGSWYKVEDVDGDTHWIFGRLLSTRLRCAVVSADKVNVRSGPGTNYEATALSPVDKYYAFKVVGEDGGWVEVEDEFQNRGWIAESLLWQN